MKNSPRRKGNLELSVANESKRSNQQWTRGRYFFSIIVMSQIIFLIKGTDVQTARGRLTGALKVAVAPPSEDDEPVESSLPGNWSQWISFRHCDWISDSSYSTARGRPPLRSRRSEAKPAAVSNQTLPLHQSYIMKLFDRSVDLAKYNQNSPLYPICRAWMQNQPRSSKIIRFVLVLVRDCDAWVTVHWNCRFSKSKKNSSAKKRVAMPNIIDELKSGDITDIQAMPAGNDRPKIQRVPSPLPFQKDSSRDNINLDYVRNSANTMRKEFFLITWSSDVVVSGSGRPGD